MKNDLPLHRPALYNPALWSRDEVKTYYIARQPLLTRLLDDLRRERPGCHVSRLPPFTAFSTVALY